MELSFPFFLKLLRGVELYQMVGVFLTYPYQQIYQPHQKNMNFLLSCLLYFFSVVFLQLFILSGTFSSSESFSRFFCSWTTSVVCLLWNSLSSGPSWRVFSMICVLWFSEDPKRHIFSPFTFSCNRLINLHFWIRLVVLL